jgi:glutathione S-transferase
MTAPVVYGPAFSTYVRTVRLTLEEKAVEYRLVEVDMLQGEHKGPAHRARHPFGKVPALEHDGFSLHETSAITRYLDAAFPEVALTPTDPRQVGRMQQAIAVIDSYAYKALITDVVVPRVLVPMTGGTPDEAAIRDALPMAELCLRVLDEALEGAPYLSGGELGLADLHLAPVLAYFGATPEGERLLPSYSNLQRWWGGIATRESMARTQPSFG